MKHEIKEELQESFKLKQKIHLKLKDGSWRNGKVIRIENNYFVFKDFKNKEEGFFFLEIIKISPYIDLEKKEEGENADSNE
ncbi:MAG: hypothetical protein WCX15_02050 [Bacilli bacterium]